MRAGDIRPGMMFKHVDEGLSTCVGAKTRFEGNCDFVEVVWLHTTLGVWTSVYHCELEFTEPVEVA